MKQCPKCGRYMTWYMVQTNGFWQCICGYNTRSVTYIYSDRTERKDNEKVGKLFEVPTIEVSKNTEDMGEVSDGYHTFNQLYYQRAALFATIVNQNKDKAWKSWKHEDGKFCFDKEGEWFIVGIDTPEGSYTYHYERKYWDMFDCEELDKGKHWDGHTEEDATRLLSLPRITSTVSEDCISREYILSFLEGEVMGDDDYIAGMNDEQREIREVVRNAPSVVPSRGKGE